MKIALKKAPYTSSIDEVSKAFQTSPDKGLSNEEAVHRQSVFGKNLLDKKKKRSVVLIYISQFLDPVIYILSGAMILAFIYQKWLEGSAVLFVILITTVIGFIMELQAIRSVEALQKLTPSIARVLRDSSIQKIKADLLVPGDVILFEAGDVIPADGRIILSNSLATKESALTGESQQVEKMINELEESKSIPDQKNMVFSGTVVSRGNGKAIVTATGNHTKIGEISKLSSEAEKHRTPLEKKLSILSRKLIWLSLILAVFSAISGYLQGKDLVLMIKTGIALAVAAIPEGLPVVTTIALARGMLRLSRKNVIIKNLESVETLGEVGVICTDKTGTLTENKQKVGTILLQNEELIILNAENDEFLVPENLKTRIFQVAVLCNNAGLMEYNIADPIEEALLDFVKKQGSHPNQIREMYPRVKEIPFETDTKRMISIHKADDRFLFCVKGSIETVMQHCNEVQTEKGVTQLNNKEVWKEKVEKMACEGLRTLVLAYRCDDSLKEEIENNLILLGVIGFEDPPRNDVSAAIETYKSAGIKVVMVTGDHPGTAQKIGKDIGILENDSNHNIVYGPDIESFEDCGEEEKRKFLEAGVFARMIPQQKLQLVSFYQNQNIVVGMLGDGVNDAPALKTADIGISMGIRGTEAAKEVADVILMDDKFTSVELAISQGRNIFENIRQFVVFLLSCNLAEICTVAIAAITNLPLPLLPLQILFLNLVTDVFPALALGMSRGYQGLMHQPPRPANEPIITKELWQSIVLYSFSIILVVIGITVYAHFYKNLDENVVNNMAFYTLIGAQLLNVFNLPKRETSFFRNKITRNLWVWGALILSVLIMVIAYYIPFLNSMLSMVPLNISELLTVFIFGLFSVLFIQVIKRRVVKFEKLNSSVNLQEQ